MQAHAQLLWVMFYLFKVFSIVFCGWQDWIIAMFRSNHATYSMIKSRKLNWSLFSNWELMYKNTFHMHIVSKNRHIGPGGLVFTVIVFQHQRSLIHQGGPQDMYKCTNVWRIFDYCILYLSSTDTAIYQLVGYLIEVPYVSEIQSIWLWVIKTRFQLADPQIIGLLHISNNQYFGVCKNHPLSIHPCPWTNWCIIMLCAPYIFWSL